MLGSGGMGKVFEAHVDGLYVAVKCVPTPTDELRMLATKEAALLALLHHVHIVGFVGSFMNGVAQHVLVLQHAGRRTLFDVCAKDTSPCASVRRSYMRGVCDALCYLHSQRVVHLDVKAENVGVDDFDHVRLLDFGLSQHVDGEDEFCLRRTVGTRQYAAPELVDRTKHPYSGFRADMWSFGILCFAIESGGSVPFHVASTRCVFFKNFAEWTTHAEEWLLPTDVMMKMRKTPFLTIHDTAPINATLMIDPYRRATAQTVLGFF